MNKRAFLASCAALGAIWIPPAPAKNPRASEAERRAGQFPNVVLRTHEDRAVRFYGDLIKDKLVTLNFMYAGCADICPGMTYNLTRVQKILGARVGREIFMYSITLEPERDTPRVLRAYAENFKVGPGWLFLTGAPEDIELLRRRLGFVDPDPKLDADKTQHIGTLRFGNERLQRWAACPALSRPEQIARAILWLQERGAPRQRGA
jgi:protein SCO1/2